MISVYGPVAQQVNARLLESRNSEGVLEIPPMHVSPPPKPTECQLTNASYHRLEERASWSYMLSEVLIRPVDRLVCHCVATVKAIYGWLVGDGTIATDSNRPL